MNIGIIGNGFVGAATGLFKCKEVSTFIFDVVPDKCEPKGTTLKDLVENCDLIFICLPTPMTSDCECYLGIIEKVVSELKQLIEKTSKNPQLILRSTVPPGTSESLGVHHMPEFLTEKNWARDFKNTKLWVVGLNQSVFGWDTMIPFMKNLLQVAKENGNINHDDIEFSTTKESEMTKYVRNLFLATKVSFFNEMEEYCRLSDINYNRVRDLVIEDTRIGNSHTAVPGPDGKRGFGGTCLPKDTHALHSDMEKNKGMKSYIISAVLDRNNNHDRIEKDWSQDKGRSTI